MSGRTPVGVLLRPSRWTLRSRLVALTLVLLAVMSVVIGVVSTLSVRSRLTQQVDEQLEAAFVGRVGRGSPGELGLGPGAISAFVSGGEITQSDVFDPSRQPGTPGVQVTAEQGAVLLPLTTDAPALPASTGSGGPPGERVDLDPVTRSVPGLGRYRIAAGTLPDGTVRVLGRPLTSVDDAVGRLVQTEVLVAVAGLLLVGVTGGVVIRSTLRPLRRVAATATRVSELPLDRGEVALAERVPAADTDPRTEVGQVGAALNRMLGHVATALAVRQASEMRVRAFVADASHELRTPLTAIRGYAELTRRSPEPVPADVAFALRRVESEAQRMTALVEDLLLLARLDSGRPLDRDPVDLTGLVVDVASDAHAAGPDHPLSLDLPDEPVVVPGDVARLHQVVANLLANTRTHTPPGTRVTVSLRRSPSEALLSVVDEGPGIPAELLPDVFARFARGDSSRAHVAGSTGLGLAIVQAVVAAHRGSVAVSSVPGRTAFTVTLPAASAGHRTRRTRPPAERPPATAR